jgi:Xaa-Pro aminopeptidase
MADYVGFAGRLDRARDALAQAGLDALLVTPGADLRYLSRYDALALERLTCLVLPATGRPPWWCRPWKSWLPRGPQCPGWT